MNSSQNNNMGIIATLYSSSKTVFTLPETSLILNELNSLSLSKRLNYFVKTNKLLNPRKGIYAQAGYSREELACSVFAPAYISLEYVLQKAGIIFQYDSRLTAVSYLSRDIEADSQVYSYRKIKNEILMNTKGVLRYGNGVNIAIPERALLDMMYLNGDCFFDNLSSLNRQLVLDLLPVYNSKILNKRVENLLNNG